MGDHNYITIVMGFRLANLHKGYHLGDPGVPVRDGESCFLWAWWLAEIDMLESFKQHWPISQSNNRSMGDVWPSHDTSSNSANLLIDSQGILVRKLDPPLNLDTKHRSRLKQDTIQAGVYHRLREAHPSSQDGHEISKFTWFLMFLLCRDLEADPGRKWGVIPLGGCWILQDIVAIPTSIRTKEQATWSWDWIILLQSSVFQFLD